MSAAEKEKRSLLRKVNPKHLKTLEKILFEQKSDKNEPSVKPKVSVKPKRAKADPRIQQMFVDRETPNFQALVIQNFQEEFLVANGHQFKTITKVFDNYYGTTQLKEMNEIKQSELDLLAKKGVKQPKQGKDKAFNTIDAGSQSKGAKMNKGQTRPNLFS